MGEVSRRQSVHLLGPGSSRDFTSSRLDGAKGMDQASQPNRRILGFSAASSSRANNGLSVPDSRESYLILPAALLCKTMDGLQKRSAGWRESAGVWAGHVIEDQRWQAEELYLHH